MAANRVGKTQSLCAETAMHLTGVYPQPGMLCWGDRVSNDPDETMHPYVVEGRYHQDDDVWPDGWRGKRFDKPVEWWTGALSNLLSRDILQKALLNGTYPVSLAEDKIGTGWIPKQCLQTKPQSRQAGISDVLDSLKIAHMSGGMSELKTKTYEQGFRMWQSGAPDGVSMDEEPSRGDYPSADDYRIFTEAQTRILSTKGILLINFTPLYGLTPMVEHFQQGYKGTFLINATWDDAPHLDDNYKQELIERYPEHERDTRTKGVPMAGEGRVFTTPEMDIRVPDQEIPRHWARIKGVDFGIDHPAAVCDLAWDRDTDVIYLTRCWRKRNANSEDHAEAIINDTPWVPVSWPHDGANREKRNGEQLKDAYIQHGCRMLSISARYETDKGGAQPVEPIILEVQERCRDGRFKAFESCGEFFEEYRNYHRRDGKITKTKDDVLKAVFYGVMMKRYASPDLRGVPQNRRPMKPILRMAG